MLVRLRKIQEQVGSSLFVLPTMFVLGAVVLGEVMVLVDESVDRLPDEFTATVDSARAVLSTVAGATLAFAGIAFSVSLLLFTMAASQYSPRVVHGLFRDPFNRRVMGFVVGTFTYCLVVLRNVRGPLEEGVEPVIPSLSILLAVLLGVISVVLIVAFISHNAHTMDVSRILHRVTRESLEGIGSAVAGDPADDPGEFEPPAGPGFTLTFDRHGWIQQISHDALLDALEPGSCLQLRTVAGRYAIPDTVLCTIWPPPADDDAVRDAVRSAIAIGESRTMQQDASYGVRQLVDVALRALSPGVNDPTTAQDAMFHLGAVMQALLEAPPPPRSITRDDRRLLLPEVLAHDELIGLAFDEIRISSAGQPTVQIYLLELLGLLSEAVRDDAAAAQEALERQAALVLDLALRADLPEPDRDRVRSAHRSRFGGPVSPG